MFESFDRAIDLVENNPGKAALAAGVLAASGLALYLSGGKLMSLLKPSVVESEAALLDTGTTAAKLPSVDFFSDAAGSWKGLESEPLLANSERWRAFDSELGLARTAGFDPVDTNLSELWERSKLNPDLLARIRTGSRGASSVSEIVPPGVSGGPIRIKPGTVSLLPRTAADSDLLAGIRKGAEGPPSSVRPIRFPGEALVAPKGVVNARLASSAADHALLEQIRVGSSASVRVPAPGSGLLRPRSTTA